MSILFKKKWFIALMLLLLIWGVARNIQKYIDSQYSDKRLPYLQMLGKHQVTIKWQSIVAEKGRILYSNNPTSFNLVKQTSPASTEHEITLDKLKTNTQYWYKLNNKTYSFKTAPDKNTQQTQLFWVLGDPGRANKNLKKVKKSAYHWLKKNTQRDNFDLILTTGDNAYTSGTNLQYQKSIFDLHGDKLSSVNLWPVYGNHDARRWAFYDIFKFPENAELGGIASHTEDYYSFNYGNVHFVFLNSETLPLLQFEKMERWLAQDLSHNKQKWTIALFHSPPYTKGSHDSDSLRDSWGRMTYMRTHIAPILEEHDVDLVLAGHSHSYERSHLIRCHYDNSDSFSKNNIVDDDNVYQKNITRTPFAGTVYTVLGNSSKFNDTKLNHPALPTIRKGIGSIVISVNSNKLVLYYLDKKENVSDEFQIIKGAGLITAPTSCDNI